MKLNNINPLNSINNSEHNVAHTTHIKKDYSQVLSLKESKDQSIQLPSNSNKELIRDFAEWYFKQGQIYEKTKSYRQAIAAYEKSNSVEPDINKATSIEDARNKAYSK